MLLSLDMAYRSFGRFRKAFTHLDTPPCSLSHHPISDIAQHSTDVLRITRPCDLTDLASLGLTLADSEQLLAGLQQEIVAAQARVHAVRRPECHGCGTACRVKDYRQHAIATLFGQVMVRLPRFRLRRVRYDRRGRDMAAARPLDPGAGPDAGTALCPDDLSDGRRDTGADVCLLDGVSGLRVTG